jgi:hypothetical protein
VRKQLVIRGSTNAAGCNWWKIDYDSGVDGWTVEDNLQKVITPQTVQVKLGEGYGRPDPRAFQEIPKDKLPPEAQKVETVLATKGPQGEAIATRTARSDRLMRHNKEKGRHLFL